MSITIKHTSKVSWDDITYPYIGISTLDQLVLFTEYGKGIKIGINNNSISNTNVIPLGKYDDFDMQYYTPASIGTSVTFVND